jgi:hypothetical protein
MRVSWGVAPCSYEAGPLALDFSVPVGVVSRTERLGKSQRVIFMEKFSDERVF